MNIQSFRQNKWQIQKVFFGYKFFTCQSIIRLHSNNPCIAVFYPNIIKPFRTYRFKKQSNVNKSLIHHFQYCICRPCVYCNLDHRVFLLVIFYNFSQSFNSRKFTTSHSNNTFYSLTVSIKFFHNLVFQVNYFKGSSFKQKSFICKSYAVTDPIKKGSSKFFF